jgi:hypothetical protein
MATLWSTLKEGECHVVKKYHTNVTNGFPSSKALLATKFPENFCRAGLSVRFSNNFEEFQIRVEIPNSNLQTIFEYICNQGPITNIL